MLTDESPMPHGEHKGERMEDVPAEYLLFLWGQDWFQESRKWREVREYIEAEMDWIIAEYHRTTGKRYEKPA
jgi:hypothetical protein